MSESTESPSEQPTSSNTDDKAVDPGGKDKESKNRTFDWARIIGSAIAAIAVLVAAIMGFVINSTIARSQRINEVFTQQSNRETARDSLRANVFDVLAQHVVKQIDDKDFQKVALLAAFHGDFSKFMDTRPVFAAFLREVHGDEARHELRRLAKRVARRQADYIVAHGGARVRKVAPWSKGVLCKVSFELDNHAVSVEIEEVEAADLESAGNAVDDAIEGRKKKRPIGDVATIVHVKVVIDNESEARFSVSFLDAPYIDNMFVLGKKEGKEVVHRIALVLLDVTDKPPTDVRAAETGGALKDPIYWVEFEAVHFPDNIIMPGDVPSAAEVLKAFGASDSHKPDEPHDAQKSDDHSP